MSVENHGFKTAKKLICCTHTDTSGIEAPLVRSYRLMILILNETNQHQVFYEEPNWVSCQSLSCLVFLQPSLAAFVCFSPVRFNSSSWCTAPAVSLFPEERCCGTVEQCLLIFCFSVPCSSLMALCCFFWTSSTEPASSFNTIPTYSMCYRWSFAWPHLKSSWSQFSHPAT